MALLNRFLKSKRLRVKKVGRVGNYKAFKRGKKIMKKAHPDFFRD